MLRLREFEPVEVALTRAEAAELAANARGGGQRIIESILPTGRSDTYIVRPGMYVGRLTLASGMSLDIASRFTFADLVHVLHVAARSPYHLDERPAPLGGGRGIVDMIARALGREAGTVVGSGLAKRYVTRRFTSAPYAGVPDATAHLNLHAGRPDRLVTRASRLSVDIPANQVIAAALHRIRLQTAADERLATRLRQVSAAFGGVSLVPDPLAAMSRDRTAPRNYEAALAISKLVLGGDALVVQGQDFGGSSVLFDMPKVWESFVEARLKAWLKAGHELQVQHPVRITDSLPTVSGAADFVETDTTGRPIRVLDAKYSRYSSQPSTDNLYQVFTYARRLAVEQAALIHPGKGERSVHRMGSVHVTTIGLPVDGTSDREVLGIDAADRYAAAVPTG